LGATAKANFPFAASMISMASTRSKVKVTILIE
jgi:hypothetical protein